VLRGGSWVNVYLDDLRAADRDWVDPDGWGGILGFRCCAPLRFPR
jgi:formylglycine-generating enzyme required for sulfatase activity